MGDIMPTDRVLVVDDELFVRELLDEYFSKLKFRVDVAESGEAALKMVAENRYNVALIDLKMTGLNGLETLKKIRESDAGVVVVLMTGYPTVESSIDALRAGAYDYIVKPFRLNELRDIVAGAIKEFEVRKEIAKLKEKVRLLEEAVRKTGNYNLADIQDPVDDGARVNNPHTADNPTVKGEQNQMENNTART
jgi:DNA-binding NtrC family response regulator